MVLHDSEFRLTLMKLFIFLKIFYSIMEYMENYQKIPINKGIKLTLIVSKILFTR